MKRLTAVLLALLLAAAAWGANHYILDGGSGDGSAWNNAWDDLPATLTRGDTYYVGDGSYASYTFDDNESESTLITIKKATAADHGTETGWNASYGDGQAVFAASITFTKGYYTFDGGSEITTIPSSTSSDYGIKIASNSDDNQFGIVQIIGVTYITLENIWVYNTSNGSINCGTVGVRCSLTNSYLKFIGCYFQNCGKDGLQLNSADFVLVERCYIERYGLKEPGDPDYHGQTVQMFYGCQDVVFRYNIWESCEGQALLSLAGVAGSNERIRFYGNIVFVPYGETTATPGFNSTGGLCGDISEGVEPGPAYLILYNNSFVNIGGDYGGTANMPLTNSEGNNFTYNNLYYNCQTVTIDGKFTSDYHASGGGDDPGGAHSETGLLSSIFHDYENGDFRLASNTTAGLALSEAVWWDGGADAFFGTVDSAVDMYGNTRTTWSRGALEYEAPPTGGGCLIGG